MENEMTIYNFFNTKTEKIEKAYNDYFNFKIKESDLIDIVLKSITDFFKLFQPDYEIPNSNYFKNLKFESSRYGTIFINDFDDHKEVPVESYNKTKNKTKNDIQMIIINKTFYVYSLIKVIKIQYFIFESQNKRNNSNFFKINDILLDNIFKFLYFYIENNINNCMFLFTHSFLQIIMIINKCQLMKFVDFLLFFFKTLKKSNYLEYELSNLTNLLSAINMVLSKNTVNIFIKNT